VPEPDIPRMDRLSAVDVASLDDREVRASLLLLAGHQDPCVADAVVNAVRAILARTRR